VDLVTIDLADIRRRALASLLGAAVGDALGAPVEFMTASEIRGKYGTLRTMEGGGWLNLAPGQVTDDTEMSLCLARSITTKGWEPHDIAERFAAWYRGRPIDIGNTCRRGIARYINTGRVFGDPNEGDAGNGAAMRVAPVALATLASRGLLRQWAVEQAHITHNHALSDAACILVGRMIHVGCLGLSWTRMRRLADESVQSAPKFAFTNYRHLATGYVVDTMQTVLHHLFATKNFEDCLVATVNQGGDADTTAAIAGAIAGASYGLDQIPRRWLKKLSPALVRELTDLANGLVERAPVHRGEPVEL
jgi:ADP-ribosyl-[dinitrogen reductase] hydrolase